MGNKFLSHIREVDAVIHMIRCFDSEDIQNVNSTIDPVRDLEIIETEMQLSDLESIQKRLEKKNKKNLSSEQLKLIEMAMNLINSGKKIDELLEHFENKEIKISGLLSIKPKLYVCNVDEQSLPKGNKYTEMFINKFGEDKTIIISAEIENQINQLEAKERLNYMEILKIKETGLNSLIKKGYKLLQLETFFTSGPEESRAWTIKKNYTAPEAAGEIHTDFQKGFIRAEAISFDEFLKNNGWSNSRVNGKMRLEGKEYIVKDGDILNFRFNT